MSAAADTAGEKPRRSAPVVILTGMSGAGRTTAITALEDLGYEAINNFPLSLIPTLLDPAQERTQPLLLGVETRTRGFSVRALADTVAALRRDITAPVLLVFLDCADDVLIKRFSETRRRHPLAPAEDAATGVRRERDVLAPIRAGADMVIDTTGLTPHDLRRELARNFSLVASGGLTVSIGSFSYKRGVPEGSDMVLDCRFLRNPYWDETLRDLDGRDPRVQGFVRDDPRFAAFLDQLAAMVLMLLPAYVEEGKVYFSVALGCTGGRHRSVTVAELLAGRLEAEGWQASLRHRELERR